MLTKKDKKGKGKDVVGNLSIGHDGTDDNDYRTDDDVHQNKACKYEGDCNIHAYGYGDSDDPCDLGGDL